MIVINIILIAALIAFIFGLLMIQSASKPCRFQGEASAKVGVGLMGIFLSVISIVIGLLFFLIKMLLQYGL